MNKPIIFIFLSYISGIFFADLVHINLKYSIILFSLVFLITFPLIIKNKKFDWLIFVLVFIIGIFLYSFNLNYIPKNHYLNKLKNIDLNQIKQIEVKVLNYPIFADNKIYFLGETKKIYLKEKFFDNLTGKIKITINTKLGINIKYGDILKLKGNIKRISEPKNIGEFNYKKYFKYKKIYFSFYAKDHNVLKIKEGKKNIFLNFAYKIKDKFLNIIYKTIPYNEAKIFEGIMFGNQKIIPEDIYDKFKITGTVHILAVSGMNVGLIAFFIFLFLKIININNKVASIITIIFISIFAVITGADPSIIRATIMAYVILFGILLERDVDIYNSLATAGLIILLIKPLDLFNIGFQLSFLATFGLVYLTKYFDENLKIFKKIPEYIRLIIITSITAQIFLIPVLANTFHQISIISVLANLVIVPVSSIITILGFVMLGIGSFSINLAKFLGASIWILIKFMIFIVDYLSKIPFACISLKSFSLFYILLYYITFLILLFDVVIKKINLKYLFLSVLFILSIIHFIPINNKNKVYIFSTNNINSIFYKTKYNKKILILGCGNFRSKFDIKTKIISFLKYNGVNNIDYLILCNIKENNLYMLNRNFKIKKQINTCNNIKMYEYIDKENLLEINNNIIKIQNKNKNIVYLKELKENIKIKNAYMLFCKIKNAKNLLKENIYFFNFKNQKYFCKDKNTYNLYDKGMFVGEM